ncbi:MAG: hypothetical protein ACFFD1_15135 [Candidatus Thorarchaeota archaeon]
MNCIIIIFIIVVISICLFQEKLEYFSPYRNTGGCTPRTGYNYLDAYLQEDYYQKYPYIYPTPQTYTTLWYAQQRKQNKALELAKQNVLEKIYREKYN